MFSRPSSSSLRRLPLAYIIPPSAVCTLPLLTKLPQSAHYHHVVSSRWFLQCAIRSTVKQAKRAWSRFCPYLFIRFSRDADLRVQTSILFPFSSSPGLVIVGRATERELVLPWSMYLFERSKNYRIRVVGRQCLPFDHRATTRDLTPCHAAPLSEISDICAPRNKLLIYITTKMMFYSLLCAEIAYEKIRFSKWKLI